MNMLDKVKSDERVVEVRESIESGEAPVQAAAKVASGLMKKREPIGPIIPVE